jgi:hypothetical protein
MTNEENQAGALTHKDRKTGLAVFGAIQIIIGCFCAFLVPVMIMAMLAVSLMDKGAEETVNARAMIPGLFVYGLMAVWFIWLGVGSIQAKRWARALTLVASWIWFVSGLTGMIVMLFMMPDMYEQMAQDGQVPANAVTVIKYVTFAFMAVIYIIIPGVFILFYGSKDTLATCEHRDPFVRWTDKCPLPVLALVLTAGCGAACTPCMGLYGWAIPFFGTIATGYAGAGIALVLTALLAYIARGLYKLDLKAWWCATVLAILWGASCTLTFARVTLMEYYEKMNFPEQQLAMLRKMAFTQTNSPLFICLAWCLFLLVYIVYIKRYFAAKPAQL